MNRLSPGTLPGPVVRPARIGIVHLGIGAFHRAHQAVFTEDAALAAGDDGWGICGVTQRSASVLQALEPQDGLYSVLERGAGAAPLRVVGVVREVLFAAATPAAVSARIADPDVHVVTLTVTEKGYQPDAAPVGRLVDGLRQRFGSHAAPLSVLSCDNLIGNGPTLRRLVLEHAGPGPLADWIEASVAFPATMVDRIVPATTDADRELAAGLLGLRDEGLVVAEPFRQWVIQDWFTGPRPAWEKAGAHLVDDVAPWETAKLRLLNATHSTLAYLGALRGHATIAAALADDELAGIAQRLMTQDASPTLTVPPGLDLPAYRASVLDRFANPALRHLTTQIAMDGSQKVPVRLLGIVTDRLAAGEQPRWAALGVAGWMAYVARAVSGEPVIGPDGTRLVLPLQDPLADRLATAVAGAGSAAALVDALLAVREVFEPELAAHPTLRALLVDAVQRVS